MDDTEIERALYRARKRPNRPSLLDLADELYELTQEVIASDQMEHLPQRVRLRLVQVTAMLRRELISNDRRPSPLADEANLPAVEGYYADDLDQIDENI